MFARLEDHPEQSFWCWLKSRLFGTKLNYSFSGDGMYTEYRAWWSCDNCNTAGDY